MKEMMKHKLLKAFAHMLPFYLGFALARAYDDGLIAGLLFMVGAIAATLLVVAGLNIFYAWQEKKSSSPETSKAPKPGFTFVKYPSSEPSLAAWCWRLTLGPASMLDGLVETLTLGHFGVGAKLNVAKNLAKARMLAQIKAREAAATAT